MENIKKFNSFAEFYPYYLAEHGNSTCRRLHFIGTTLVIGILAYAIGRGSLVLLLALPLAGLQLCLDRPLLLRKEPPRHLSAPVLQLAGRLCDVPRHDPSARCRSKTCPL